MGHRSGSKSPSGDAFSRQPTGETREDEGLALINPNADATGTICFHRPVRAVVKPHAFSGLPDDKVVTAPAGAWNVPRAGPMGPFRARAV